MNDRFHQPAKEWRCKGSVQQTMNKSQEPNAQPTDVSKASCYVHNPIVSKEQVEVPVKSAEKSHDQPNIQTTASIQTGDHSNSVSKGNKWCISS